MQFWLARVLDNLVEKFYFGVPGAIQEVRAPESGMGFTSNIDAEVTDLVSGGRSVYRAPTAFKSFSLSWKSGSAGLQHLINTYNGQFGGGPYYMTDPSIGQSNILPPRWSNAWQLGYQSNGWGKPNITAWAASQAPSPYQYQTNRRVTFRQAPAGSSVPVEGVLKTRHIRIPGKAYRLNAQGTTTGGAGIRVRGYDASADSWVLITTFTAMNGTSAEVISAANTTYSMIELDIYLPLGSTLMLYGMTLGTEDYHTLKPNEFMPAGQGVGAVQFSGASDGNLVSSVIDRIGLSLDFTEVQNISNRSF